MEALLEDLAQWIDPSIIAEAVIQALQDAGVAVSEQTAHDLYYRFLENSLNQELRLNAYGIPERSTE